MKTVGIYCITSPTNKKYVGQSWNIRDRVWRYSRLHCKEQTVLYNSLAKYGFEAHTIEVVYSGDTAITQSQLDQYENFFWREYKTKGFTMLNVREPNGSHGRLSEETKMKLREARKNRVLTEETKRKISEAMKGKKFTEAHKLAISLAKKGKPLSEERKQAIRMGMTEEVRKQISDSKKGQMPYNFGKKYSDETRRRIRLARWGRQ